MKRILAAILLVVLAFSSVILLSSCGAKPELDLEEAKDNLEDEKYTVYYDDDAEGGVEESLYASNKDDFLSVTVYTDAKYAKLQYEELKMEMKQEKENAKLKIKILEYELEEYSKDIDKDEWKEEIKEYEEELEQMEEIVIGRSGKTVWYGTKDAIKASKGK